MALWRSAKSERAYLRSAMRDEGKTWVEIAEHFAERFNVNPRVAFRWAHGWSQDDVARRWTTRWPKNPRTRQSVATAERWPDARAGKEPPLSTLINFAKLYECDVSDLVRDVGRHRGDDVANQTRPRVAVSGPALTPATPLRTEADQMDPARRSFTAAALVAGLGFTEPFRGLLSNTTSNRRVIGQEQVRHLQTVVESIERHDALSGGGVEVLESVEALHRQVAAWLQARSFTAASVGDELQHLRGELLQWAGWLAFDADQPTQARRHTEEALVQARLIDDPVLEVQALNTMTQLLLAEDRSVESLQAAQAAQRISRGWATPRLATLFHLRAARAHAGLGDRHAFSREVINAKTQLDLGPHPDDPLFVHFITRQELDNIEGLSYLALDQPDRAVPVLRAATEGVEPLRQRNLAYYTVWLAAGAALQHDLTMASTIGLDAVPLVADLQPGRTRRLLADLRAHVEPHRRASPAIRDFASAYDDALR